MARTYREAGREIPVYDEVDVLVCGGGPAGFCAAVAAARTGARTLLIEQTNCLGGIATAGGHNHICLYTAWGCEQRVVGGIPYEMVRRVVETGYGVYGGGSADFELEGLKLALEQMAAEANVRLLYHTLFAEALVEGGRCAGAVIQNKSGRQAVLAKRVIDATGDADVAASAGAPWEMGRPSDSAVQPCTLMFHIGGVHWDQVRAWRTDYQMQHVWAEAQENGDMEPFQDNIMGFWWTPTRPDQVGINFTHVVGCDPTDAESITAATIEGRRQAFHMIPVFRKYVPGMEDCFLVTTAAVIGTRESRRILGDVVLTDDDMFASREWPDSIGYGCFYIDVHNLDGPGMDQETFHPEPGFRYQVPYRVLVPRDVENLLVAGRCISVTHRGLGSMRVMSQCLLTGEAAGVAAALSLEEGVPARQVSVPRLQEALRSSGGLLDEADIAAANPA